MRDGGRQLAEYEIAKGAEVHSESQSAPSIQEVPAGNAWRLKRKGRPESRRPVSGASPLAVLAGGHLIGEHHPTRPELIDNVVEQLMGAIKCRPSLFYGPLVRSFAGP